MPCGRCATTGSSGARGSSTFGLNLRMPEVNAAIAAVQMRRLPSFLEKRRENANMLSELLKDVAGVTLPEERKHEKANWCLYTISADRRDEIRHALNGAGFGASVYYETPVHMMPFYANMRGRGRRLPATERAAGRVLSLPVHPGVRPAHLKRMARIIREVA